MCSPICFRFSRWKDAKKWNGRQNNHSWPNGKMVGFTFLPWPATGTGSCEAFQLCWWGRDTDDTPWQSMKHIWIVIRIDTWYTNGKETQSDDVWLQGPRWKTATLWPLFLKICGVYDPQGPEVMRPINTEPETGSSPWNCLSNLTNDVEDLWALNLSKMNKQEPKQLNLRMRSSSQDDLQWL